MSIEVALQRVERGDGTVTDAEILRQAIATKTVQVEGLRQGLDDARRELRTLLTLTSALREAMKDAEAWSTVERQRTLKDAARALDVYLLRAAGEKLIS